MKVRAILKSLLFAYALTGVALLLLALVLFAFDLGETAVDAGIIIIYVLACFMGGFMAGRIVRKDKYLWGVITGLAYYVLLLTVSVMAVFSEDMHTRFPVYEDNTDNVIGIINMKDLLVYPKNKPFSIRNILREPYFTYEYKATADLMIEMRKASVNLAIVLDEYGATAGLVTLEDLLEEIVGEIRDEYDEDEVEDIKEIQPEREYVVQGSAKLDDINEALHINLESEDYDSIGGYIIEQLDCLPKEGQSVTLESGIRLVVDRLDKNRIELVHIWLPEKKTETEEQP